MITYDNSNQSTTEISNRFFDGQNFSNQFVSDITGEEIPDSFMLGGSSISPFLNNELQSFTTTKNATTESRSLSGSTSNYGSNISNSFPVQSKEQDYANNGSDSGDSPLHGDNGNDVSQNINNAEESANPIETAESGAGTVLEFGSSIGSMVGGQILAAGNSTIMDSLASGMANNTRMGLGPSEHNVLQETTAQMQQSDMHMYSGLAAASIATGSLFGPEGLVAGAVVGAAIDAIGYVNSEQDDAMVNTTSGDMIPS